MNPRIEIKHIGDSRKGEQFTLLIKPADGDRTRHYREIELQEGVHEFTNGSVIVKVGFMGSLRYGMLACNLYIIKKNGLFPVRGFLDWKNQQNYINEKLIELISKYNSNKCNNNVFEWNSTTSYLKI
jgi:hypothetical protein